MLDTEEWLKKQGRWLDRDEIDTTASITFFDKEFEGIESSFAVTTSGDQQAKKAESGAQDELPQFVPQELSSDPDPVPGFGPGEVKLTVFPMHKSPDVPHLPGLTKVVLCGDYPSSAYGDLVDPYAPTIN